jgi:hypothetical protein
LWLFNGTRDFDHGAGVYNLTATGSSGADYFIAKYDQNGSFLWAKNWPKNSPSISYLTGIFDIKTDNSDNIYITGGFRATEDFDPGAGTANLTPTGNDDIFVAKYNSSGGYVWAFKIGGANWDGGQEIDVTSTGEVVVSGEFEIQLILTPELERQI